MTREVKITLDIYCVWNKTPPSYRVYLDNDLITERTYIWNISENTVKEIFFVNLDEGDHRVRITPVDPKFKFFGFKNLTVDDVKVNDPYGQFTIK